MDPLTSRPTIIQVSSEPVFRIRGGPEAELRCSHCNDSILIDRFVPNHFVGILVKCYKCGNVSNTGDLESGEIVPSSKVMYIPAKILVNLNRPLEIPIGHTITTDEAIIKALDATQPRQPPDFTFPDGHWLDAQIGVFDALTGGRYAAHKAKVQNAIQTGSSGLDDYPFAWAALQLGRAFDRQNRQNIGLSIHRRAIRILILFEKIVKTWGHHPRFAAMAKESISGKRKFWHFVHQLIFLSYLYQMENIVGLSIPSSGDPNPDLYVRMDAHTVFYLEVKAPHPLNNSSNAPLHIDEATDIILRQLKDSRRQINEERPGVLLIGGSIDGIDVINVLEKAASLALERKGHDHTHLEAIIVTLSRAEPSSDVFEPQYELTHEFRPVRNPHFCGSGHLSI